MFDIVPYNDLPQNVKDIVDKYSIMGDLDYIQCKSLVNELENIGWTCDYYLDAIPFDLKPL